MQALSFSNLLSLCCWAAAGVPSNRKKGRAGYAEGPGKHRQVAKEGCLSSRSLHRKPAVVAKSTTSPRYKRPIFYLVQETKACNLWVCNHTCGNLDKYPLKMSKSGFKIAIAQIVFTEGQGREKRGLWNESQAVCAPGWGSMSTQNPA